MNITTIGIDLAKNLFQVHGVNEVSVPAWPSAQPAIFRGECASLWRSVRPMPGWIGAA
jgi:hypothetical protein